MAGSHGSGPAPAARRRPVSSRRQSRTAARSPAVSSSRDAAAALRWVRGSLPWAASRMRWARRVGQAGSSVRPSTTRSAPASRGRSCGPRWCSAATWRASSVPGGRRRPGGWRGRPGRAAWWWRRRGSRRGRGRLEEVGGGVGVQVLRSDDGVRVAVADDLEVEVVGVAPRVSIVYSCWRDSVPVARPCMVSTETPWAPWTVVAYPSSVEAATYPGGQGEGAPGAGVADPQRPSVLPCWTVQRSPFLTQSVVLVRSRRSLSRVMTCPRRRRCCRPPGHPRPGPEPVARWVRRWVWARWFSSETSSRVGASMIESSPWRGRGPRR
jgi:hypothetical protein